MRIHDYLLVYCIFGVLSGLRDFNLCLKINKQIKEKNFGMKLIDVKVMRTSAIGAAILWPIYWIYSFIQAYSYTRKVRKMFPDMPVTMWDFL